MRSDEEASSEPERAAPAPEPRGWRADEGRPDEAASAASLPAEPPSTARRSCPSAAPAREVPLSRPGAAIDVAGRTFLYAWHRDGLEEPRVVLVSLDARGELAETPLEAGFAHPTVIGAAAEGLVSLWMPPGSTPRMQRVRASAAGVAAEPSVAVAMGAGWPSAIASSASSVLVLHRPATPTGSAGPNELLVLDPSGRVVRDEPGTSVADMACVADRCAVARLTSGGFEVALVAADGSEEGAVRAPVHRQCRELERLEVDGSVLWLVRADPSFAVALVRGVGLVEVDTAALPSESGCGETLYAFDHAPWPALSTGYRSDRAIYAWDPEGRRIVALGTLAADARERHTSRAFVDGAIEIAFDASSGMMHSPTEEDGTRRYFEHHSFEGGDTGWIQPYLGPCDSSRASVGPR